MELPKENSVKIAQKLVIDSKGSKFSKLNSPSDYQNQYYHNVDSKNIKSTNIDSKNIDSRNVESKAVESPFRIVQTSSQESFTRFKTFLDSPKKSNSGFQVIEHLDSNSSPQGEKDKMNDTYH